MLSRKLNESVVINENIVVSVVEIRGDKIRLGIQAPREVPVHRAEVQAEIWKNNGAPENPPPPAPVPEGIAGGWCW